VLTRWERSRPATIDNTVLLSRELAEQHDKAALAATASPRFARAVRSTLDAARSDV